MRKYVTAVAGGLLALMLVVVLAVADAKLFDDQPEYAPLYNDMLKDALTRFGDANKQVPARAPAPVDEMGGPVEGQPAPVSGMAGMARPVQQMPPKPQPGAAGQGAFQNFGTKPQSPAGLMPMAGAAAMPGQPDHVHDDGGIHMKQGSELMAKRAFEQAIGEFRIALQENPTRAHAHHSIGDCLRYLGKTDESIAAYEEVMKLNPGFYCCYLHMGEIHTAAGKPDQAEQAFAKGIEGYRKQISEGGAQGSVAAYHLSKFFVDQKRNPAEAVTLAEQAVAAMPSQAIYLHLLARAYEQVGRKPDAIATIDKAIALNPEHLEIYQGYRGQLTGVAPVTPPLLPPTP